MDWQSELIASGETGILVPHGNVKELGSAVAQLLESPNVARSLGRSLRDRALEMFDPERLDEHERREYAKIIGSKRKEQRA